MARAASPEGELRIVSYNIKGFGSGFTTAGKDPNDVRAAYSRILSDVTRLRPHVVCLNEVLRAPLPSAEGDARGDILDAFAEDLGMMQVYFAHATPGVEHFGNAILVDPSLEVLGTRSAQLDGGSVVWTKDGREKQIVRGILAVHLHVAGNSDTSGEGGKLAVLTTHWDHISGGERQRQASSACQLQEDLSSGLPHILCGDLNALKRSDYSGEEWQRLVDRNQQNGWGEPEDCASLRVLEEAGYVDLLERSLRLDGCSLAVLPPEAKMTSPSEAPNTRIDYAYLSPALTKLLEEPDAQGSTAAPSRARASVERASGSDHLPLCVTLPLHGW